MKLRRLKPFVRQYARLPSAIRKKTDRQIARLAQDMRHPGLYAKKMVGVGDIWEGRIDQHYRFTFQIRNDKIILRKVGTHEIYRQP